jgi:two-component system, NarL family, sensor histidine kinase UhpB
MAIGGWIVAGWHGWLPGTPPPELAIIQYDAAWAFVFAGASLIATGVRWSTLGRGLAIVPIAVGALRLAAYVAPGNISVHPLLASPWLPYGDGNYNDMGVLTALVFVVLGCALASLRPSPRGPWRSVWVALLASIALALSLLLLVGSWTSSPAVSQWMLLTGGENADSLLLILLAATLLAYGLLGSKDERDALSRSMPVIVFMAVFACVLVLWRALAIEETRVIQHSTSLVAADIKSQVERDLTARAEMLERLAARTQIPPFDETVWQRDAGALLSNVNEFRLLAWAGPDYVIRSAVPDTIAASAIGYNLQSDAVQAASVKQAVANRRPIFSPVSELMIGGRGVVIYVPVFENGELRGIGVGALGNGNWLQSLIDGRFIDHYIELIEAGQVIQAVDAGSAPGPSQWSQEVPLSIRDANWSLRVTPTRDYLARAGSGLPDAVLALGTVLAILLAISTYLFQTTRRRARELDHANLQLQRDIARRYHIEQELRQSQTRTQLIINAIRDCAIYMLDVEGRIASWNPGAQALNGYTAEEAIGKPFSMLYPADREQPPEKELTIATRRGSYEEECWHVRKDGARYCGDDVVSAIRDENGQLRGFSVVTRDATQRIELHEQTQRSRDFYFALFSDFPNLVWRSDTSGACDYLNQAWLEYTGVAREKELGNGWLEGMHPDDRPRWSDCFTKAFAARRPFEVEFRLRAASGAFGSMICVGRPYHDMRGNFCGYLCSCYDNTVRRKMEIALKESEQRYEGMTANVPGMVFQLVRDAQKNLSFAYVNRGSQTLTGVAETQLINDANTFFSLVPEDERSHLFATLHASADQLSNWNWSGRLRLPNDPNEKWINIRAQPRHADHGTLWDGLVFDDTQSRLAQLEIERSREELRSLSRYLQTVREEEKARIAREVHDELGSTLTALRMDLDWLGEQLPAELAPLRQKRSAMVKLVEAAVAATRKIVTDLRPSILDDLGLAAALRWQASEHQKHTGIEVIVETPEPDVEIERDVALTLFRIFQEALTNVARHAKATGVAVELDATGAAYILQVRDNGVGMNQGDISKPESHGIRGIRERAQQLGGSLSVASQPGRGTTLIVSIPRSAKPTARAAGPVAAYSASRSN